MTNVIRGLLVLMAACPSAYAAPPTVSIDISSYTASIMEIEKPPAPANQTAEAFLINFFSSTTCLPASVQKKIETENKSAKLIPEEINSSIKDIKEKKVTAVFHKDLISMLHSYEISTDNTGKAFEVPQFLKSARTLNTYNPFRNIDPSAPRFIYMLDCTGYVSHLAKADVGLTVLNAKVTTSAAFDLQQTYVASRALMANAIATAMVPDLFGSKQTLQNVDALSIIANLLTELNIAGMEKKVRVPRFVDVISTSKSGSSKLQGQVAVSGEGNLGFGTGSVSTENKSGFGVTKTIEFLSPDSAIVGTEGTAFIFEAKDIKKQLASNLKRVQIIAKTRVNDAFTFKLDVPENICNSASWRGQYSMIEGEKTITREKPLLASYDEYGCTLSLAIDEQVQKLLTDKRQISILPTGGVIEYLSETERPNYAINL
jgi:hypothetical protein